MGNARRITRPLIALGATALIAAGCGGNDLADQVRELAEAAQQATEDADGTDGAAAAEMDEVEEPTESTETVEAIDLAALVAQPPTATVYQRGFEFTVTGLEVVDLDQQHAEETGGEVESRVHGFEFIADIDVFNATSSAGLPNRTAVSLQWNEPGSDNVINLRGNLEVREMPSHASSSGQVIVPISVDDAELLDVDTAALIFGEIGRSAAVLPLGSQPELVTRLPVEQPSLDGVSFEADGLQVTITRGMVFHETASDGPLPDDDVLLELTYEIDATDVAAQTCSTRGTGAWSLLTPDGTGVVELGVSERCVSGGQVGRDILTGFFIDADYGGEYTLGHERTGGGETFAGSTTITLEEREGSTHAERN